MQILLLTPSLPYPPHQGGALRNLGILRGLHDAGHVISLLSFHEAASGAQSEFPGPLSDYCARIETLTPPLRSPFHRLRDLFVTGQPDLARRFDDLPFRERLRDLLRQTRFDLIQFEGLEMAINLAYARQLQPSAKLIYDAHNAEYALQNVIANVEQVRRSRLAASIYSRIQAQRIARFERAICTQADAVIAVSPEDAAALSPFRPDHQVKVLPNGIFTDDYIESDQGVELGGRCWFSRERWIIAPTSMPCSGSPPPSCPEFALSVPMRASTLSGKNHMPPCKPSAKMIMSK